MILEPCRFYLFSKFWNCFISCFSDWNAHYRIKIVKQRQFKNLTKKFVLGIVALCLKAFLWIRFYLLWATNGLGTLWRRIYFSSIAVSKAPNLARPDTLYRGAGQSSCHRPLNYRFKIILTIIELENDFISSGEPTRVVWACEERWLERVCRGVKKYCQVTKKKKSWKLIAEFLVARKHVTVAV